MDPPPLDYKIQNRYVCFIQYASYLPKNAPIYFIGLFLKIVFQKDNFQNQADKINRGHFWEEMTHTEIKVLKVLKAGL